MIQIKEFLLDKTITGVQTLYMPVGTQLFTVVDTQGGLFIIAAVDIAETSTQLRSFKICDNRGWFTEQSVKYVGSFETDVGTQHVVELIEENV